MEIYQPRRSPNSAGLRFDGFRGEIGHRHEEDFYLYRGVMNFYIGEYEKAI